MKDLIWYPLSYPVYKVEPYLERSVWSVQNQTWTKPWNNTCRRRLLW